MKVPYSQSEMKAVLMSYCCWLIPYNLFTFVIYVYSIAAMIIWYNCSICQRTCPCISIFGPSFIFLQLVWICWNVRIISCNLLYLMFVFGLVSINNMYSGTSLVIAATLFCILPNFVVLISGLCSQLSQTLSCQVAGCW